MSLLHWIHKPKQGRSVIDLLKMAACAFVVVVLGVLTSSAVRAATCNNGLVVKDKLVTAEELKPLMIAAGVPENPPENMATGMAQFGQAISKAEGGWHSVNCYGCVGFIQWCGATFFAHFHYNYASSPGTFPSNQSQVVQALSYWRGAWRDGRRYSPNVKDRQLCMGGRCVTGTDSSIVFACQFGCGGSGGGKLGGLVRNGMSCDGPNSARDGNKHCVLDYLIRGAGYNVSYITGQASDELNTVRISDGAVVNDPNCGTTEGTLTMPGSSCSSAPAIAPIPKCPDLNLLAGITLASHAYKNAMISAVERGYKAMPVSGAFESCLQRIEDYFNRINMIVGVTLSGNGALLFNLLNQVLGQVMTAMCDYVVTAINNALNSICIPVPDLGNFSLSIPRLQSNSNASTCNGISPGTLLGITNRFPQSLPRAQMNGISLGAELYRAR